MRARGVRKLFNLAALLLFAFSSDGVAAEEQMQLSMESPKQITGRINNGVVTSDFPSTGLFFTGGGTCTATLIGCQTALTAAHCVCPEEVPCNPSPAGVVYFQHSGIYQVVGSSVNPGWAPHLGLGHDDLAILRLAAPVALCNPLN